MALAQALASASYSDAVKLLDASIIATAADSDQVRLSQLLSNRAFCCEQLNLKRKALKDYEAALRSDDGNLQALLRHGQLLHRMGQTTAAETLWKKAAQSDSLTQDIALIIKAQALLQDANSAMLDTPPSRDHATPAAASPTSVPSSVLSGQPTASSATDLQVAHPTENGTASAARKAKSCARSKLSPALLLLDAHEAIQQSVEFINSGKLAEAEALLDSVIERNQGQPPGSGIIVWAHVSRGTARALTNSLEGAVEDFSKAVEMEPRYAESWKRRGQARAALGDSTAALQDLQKAADLTADRVGKAECLMERGRIFQKDRDNVLAALEFEAAARMDPRDPKACMMMGLCYTSQGRLQDGIDAYHKALRMDPSMAVAWTNMGVAHKEIGQVAAAEKTFAVSIQKWGDAESVSAMRMVAELRRGLGEHYAAIHILDRAVAALPSSPDPTKAHHFVELLFLRGACYHALGYHRSAVRDYDTAMGVQLGNDATAEARGQQALAFYQSELARYVHKRLDWPLSKYLLDKDISPVFKENWAKKTPPDGHLMASYSLQDPIPSPDKEAPLPPPPDSGKVAAVVRAADAIGSRLKYSHQGFLANKRQLRMGGLAAIELAQTMRAALKHQRVGVPLRVAKEGASGESSASGSHVFGWRDAMDILVRWRQLSEPNDQVIWVDLLTKTAFEAGFGSHTPMFSGQTRCVRYYMNFSRALSVLKGVLLTEGHAFDVNNIAVPVSSPAKKEAVAAAKTAQQLWEAVGVDSWAVVPIESISRPGHDLEGVRLTVVRVPEVPNGYEFSIRTPVTPPRWMDFDEELSTAWSRLMEAMACGNKPAIALAALHFAYYWYNFMPLARGSAVVGGMFLQAVFLAAGMPTTAYIPADYQTDWEAILSSKIVDFVSSVSAWMLPEDARPPVGTDQGDDTVASGPTAVRQPKLQSTSAADIPPLESLPEVGTLLSTLRQRLEALNGADMPRLHCDTGTKTMGRPLPKP